jgi:hypothetical protein
LLRRIFRREGILGRENEWGTKNSLSRGKVGFVMGCGTEGKEEPRKMSNPIRRGTLGSEGSFEDSVHSFNKAIGLRMKSSGVDMENVKEGGKGVPDGGSELGTLVRGDGVRNTKAEIEEEMRASAQDLEEVEERGVASSHLVVRSIMVRMCVCP